MISLVEKFRFHVKSRLGRQALGEFFGTFLFTFAGLCVNAQTMLGAGRQGANTFIQVNLGWGLAVTFGVLAVAKTSGGHINPAVTAMLLSFGQINALTAAVYVAAQTAGAFVGAAATYLFYYEAINNAGYDFAYAHTASIFATGLQLPDHLSWWTVLVDQAVGAGLLCLVIAVCLDRRNEVPAHAHALLFGLAVVLIGCAFGHHIGYPVNPARDFGPRLFALIVYGSSVFTRPYPAFFLLPVVGPLIGGALFGWLYYFFAGWQIPDTFGRRQELHHHDHGDGEEADPLNRQGGHEKVVP